MTLERALGLGEQHLLPDAVVAFVDGELTRSAHDRVTSHLASCTWCAAEITAQRQASAAVRAATTPTMSAGLLAALRAIPQETELPATPDGLAVTADGQLVAIQRPDRAAALFGASAPLGSGPKLGEGGVVLGKRNRRAAQGAGVVVSGLVLGALALVNTGGPDTTAEPTPAPPHRGDAQPIGFAGQGALPSLSPSFGMLAAR
ncbi:anti-sigma factor family protein [Actinokineospora cianjurensis]|uniref:Putative zinc finger protein n=1 Tax=Actinokineospora cianjurensis TaxID=585224 RepID=A0A421AXX5_9PSEU|nr:anti-sigma factor [Actinokineospora cianjurensis]RLK54638.1 putative zinc finger protein [Actinokineospora cianjurensis]